jgi:hypothetical protein
MKSRRIRLKHLDTVRERIRFFFRAIHLRDNDLELFTPLTIIPGIVVGYRAAP